MGLYDFLQPIWKGAGYIRGAYTYFTVYEMRLYTEHLTKFTVRVVNSNKYSQF